MPDGNLKLVITAKLILEHENTHQVSLHTDFFIGIQIILFKLDLYFQFFSNLISVLLKKSWNFPYVRLKVRKCYKESRSQSPENCRTRSQI